MYRSDIDGLRAIAVLSVIIYHARIYRDGRFVVSGGFLGVDVFLVISGYLITLLVLREPRAGTFNLRRFYHRRAMRILPALYVMLFFTLPIAWFQIFPKELKEYCLSLLSCVLMGANFYFNQEDSYIAAPSLLKPLLHTWSLSLEEQFYLVVPLGFYALRKLGPLAKNVVIACAVVSFSYAQFNTDRVGAFFLPWGRVWEFLAGSAIAFFPNRQLAPAVRNLGPLLAGLGLSMVFASMLFFNDQMHHPSVITLVPVVGTMLILQFGETSGWVGRFLSLPLLVGIGTMSYSLYLWHQPVFVLQRLTANGMVSPYQKLGTGLGIFLISYLSWRWVEQPFRNLGNLSGRFSTGALGGLGFSLLMVGVLGINSGGFSFRFPKLLGSGDPVAAWWELKKDGKPCHRNDSLTPCTFELQERGENWILMGDSHAGVIASPLLASLRNTAGSLTTFLWGGCPFIIGATQNTRSDFIPCELANERKAEFLQKAPPATVVIVQRMALWVEGSRFDNGEGGVEVGEVSPITVPGKDLSVAVADTIKHVLENGHRVVLVYPIPEVGWNVPFEVGKRIKNELGFLPDMDSMTKWMRSGGLTVSLEGYFKRNRRAFQIYDAIGAHERLLRIYPHLVFCSKDSGRCRTHDEINFFYSDDDHLSLVGGSLLVTEIIEQIEKRWGQSQVKLTSQASKLNHVHVLVR